MIDKNSKSKIEKSILLIENGLHKDALLILCSLVGDKFRLEELDPKKYKKRVKKFDSKLEFVKSESTRMRKDPTEGELCFKQILKYFDIKFNSQHVIETNNSKVFILDFYVKSMKLCFEIDGGYHKLDDQIKKDKIRDAELCKLGISTIRFANSTVINNQSVVVKELTRLGLIKKL